MRFEVVLLLIVFMSPLVIYVSVLFWFGVLSRISELLEKLSGEKENPCCSIDPRDHYKFFRAEDGSGWIEDVCVIKKD